MGLLYFLADAFIRAFGITRPDEATRRRAAWFIAGLLALMVGGLVAAGVVIHAVLR